MDIITADFETYYDKDFSLSKITTEEYVRDPKFEVIMLGLRMPNGSHRLITGTKEEVQYEINSIEWNNYAVLCHNTLFDGAILSWVFGVNPRLWLDTLGMARAMHGNKGNSLKALTDTYGLSAKGSYVANMMGRNRESLSPSEFKLYSEYCLNDCDITHDLFMTLAQGWYSFDPYDKRDAFPRDELKLIDATIRMYTEPRLELDLDRLLDHLDTIVTHKQQLLSSSGMDRETLMSNAKFAAILTRYDVLVPTKISPATGKEAYAFAKTDEGMKALLEHPNVEVQAIVAARLGVKSTIEETRTARFISIASRGKFPVPLRYYGTKTGRWSGTDKINLQNLPAHGENVIKECILPPKGYVIIDCDSSNIEARGLAWLAGQDDLVEDFANKIDVYCKMATSIYGRVITKADESERFLGKTVVLGCLAEGTLVLCNSGWKLIEQVTTNDQLWDGRDWVWHQGLVRKGMKETLNLSGLWLTPDHKVLCGTHWLEAQSLHLNASMFSRALGTGAENLPSLAMYKGSAWGWLRSLLGVTVRKTNTLSTYITLSISRVLDVMYVPKNLLQKLVSCTGGTLQNYLTMNIGRGYSIDYHQRLGAAINLPTKHTPVMEVGASKCVMSGGKIKPHSLSIYKRFPGGTCQVLKWIGQIITKATNPAILGLVREVKMFVTGGALESYRKQLQTYDIAYSGPRNRYTVLTERGPLIVHNCGYGTGAVKLQGTLAAAKNPRRLALEECERIIGTYRTTYPKIPLLWKQADRAITAISRDEGMWLGREGVCWVEGKRGIKLPNGMYIKYPELRGTRDDYGIKWEYKDDYGFTKLYGAKLIENVTQALARIIIGQQLLRINKRYKVVLTVHDACAWLARKEEAEEAAAYGEECMRWVPEWAQGWPLNCEYGIGENYGKC